MPLSKPFVIATEGPTVDGRNIDRNWIVQMAAAYAPSVYTAVANLEHYLSAMPDSVFGAYGKVVSLSTQEAVIMGDKKLQLLAIVDANEALVALQKSGKKAFCSMEVMNNFIGKGVAYLGGLAFTDTPASIGTESMKFSFSGAPCERYAFTDEVALEFEAEEPKQSAGDSLFAKVKEVLGFTKKDVYGHIADQGNAIEAIALSQKYLLENFASIEEQLADMGASVKLTEEAIKARAEEFAALESKLDAQPDATNPRPHSAGGPGQLTTDC